MSVEKKLDCLLNTYTCLETTLSRFPEPPYTLIHHNYIPHTHT